MPVLLRKRASNTSIPSIRGGGIACRKSSPHFKKLKFVLIVALSAPVAAPLLFRIVNSIFERSYRNYDTAHMPHHHHLHGSKQKIFADVQQKHITGREASINAADSELSLVMKDDEDDALGNAPSSLNKKTKAKMSAMPMITVLQGWTDPLPPKVHPGLVRCVILSDTHGQHWDLEPLPLPRGDVLIHLGDVANRGSMSDVRSFVDFIVDQQASGRFEDIVFIEGNHDRDLEHPDRLNLVEEYRDVGTLLKDQVVRVARGKLSLLGVSWSACESHDFSQAKRASDGQEIDILLTHCPPSARRASNLQRFSDSLGAPLHLFGHVHRKRGVVDELPPRTGNEMHATSTSRSTTKINCSSIPANRPVVVDVDPAEKRVVLIHCPCPSRY